MLTSLPPYKHGAKRNGLSIYTNVKTLPEILGEHNYKTGAFVSNWALKKKLTGLDRGFDIYDEVFTKKRFYGLFSDEGEAPEVNARAYKWLEKNTEENFFLWVHYTEPHDPYLYHEKFDFGYDEVDPSNYPKKSHFGKIKNYDTEIGFVDFYIGELLEKIKSLDLYEESLIIFLSDHGESFGEHNYYSHGRKLYNSTLHVPLLVKLPGNEKSSTVIEGNISLKDIPPSILALVSLKDPGWMEGEDIFEDQSKRVLFFEAYKGNVLFSKGKGFKLRVKPLRYGMLNDHTKLIFDSKYEAYNLEEDRFESKNIYKNPDKKFKALSNTLVKHIIEVRKYIQLSEKYFKQNSTLTKKELEKLKAMGYIKD
jgi:arylsulfatase A-like enzyme